MYEFERFLVRDTGLGFEDLWNLCSEEELKRIAKSEFERWLKIDKPDDYKRNLGKEAIKLRFGFEI